jgi:uncharacterized protein (TIGR02757 family)
VNKRQTKIKDILEKLYRKYNHRHLIKPDPLYFVYNYNNKADMEIAALLASALAYGRVSQIEKSLTKLFNLFGRSPFEYVSEFDNKKREKLKNFKHRFTTGDNLSDLLQQMQTGLKKFGSIEGIFMQGYNDDENIIPALSKFCSRLTKNYKGSRIRGLNYLLASPQRQSASKRLNLFLRWMIRDDDVDTGIWKSIDKAKLIVPVDVHMGRLCRILGLHNRNTVALAAAVEITESFKQIQPDDPAKYDFALSRVGITENCSGKFRKECKVCELSEFCKFDVKNILCQL